MAVKRGFSSVGVNRNNRGGGSCFSIAVLVFFALLAPVIFFFGRGLYLSDQYDNSSNSVNQNVDWRQALAEKHLKSLFTKEVIDVITASTNNLGPLSLDSFRKSNLSASWKLVGLETSVENNVTSEPIQAAEDIEQVTPGSKRGLGDDQALLSDTPAKLARRQLREKRREKRVAELIQKDDEVIVKLENAAIERTKSVDSAVLGKYSIWRRENDNENTDSTVRLIRDQIIMAGVYVSIAKKKKVPTAICVDTTALRSWIVH